LVPGVEAIKAGEIAKRREQMFNMFQGFWRACISDDDEGPFIADAIIANPPSFAHVHCAEKLGCPLHLMFTFPYSPTQEIAHPLAFIQTSNLGSEVTNALTYPMVEMMTWQGLGDLVNRFREKTLSLEPVATLWAPGMIDRLKVPYTYMWSAALIPKPKDWDDHIEVTGFVFLDQSKDYTPPEPLQKFLEDGDPPVYIGFGSIVVDDPDKLTNTLFDAIEDTGVRALVSKGWGGLGAEDATIPDNVFMLENTPHDWLFSRVSAVVHHGGAGTTAIGLLHGKPTMVVPFFGDQPFWGAMIHNAGAGPEPVPHKDLTSEKLADGIRTLLSEKCQHAAKDISRRIKEDDGNGAQNAVASFYRGLTELDSKGKRGLGEYGLEYGEGGPMGPGEGKWGVGAPGIHCDILEEKLAVWRVRGTTIRLSAVAAGWFVKEGLLEWKDFRLLRHTEWNDYDGPGEPLSGGFSAFFGSIAGVAKGFCGIPLTLIKGAKRIDAEVDLRPATTRKRFRNCFHKQKKTDDRSSSSGFEGECTIPHDIAHGTKKSLLRIARSTIRAPLDVSLAVAQGFHNAPRLYGDTVRRPARITGFHSGMAAAGKELALGFYDGFSGLILQPYRGARNGGVLGAAKGVGRGLGGVVFKTQAGLAGCVAYPLKGIHREVRKGRDRKVLRTIVEARQRQARMELERIEVAERMWNGWEKVKEERKRERERRWWRRRGKRREGSWEKVMEPEGAVGGVVEDNALAPIDETESEVEEVRKREQVERSVTSA
jgi:UDP:flavonoid glycosyltransferase YjiC (YdhE family)